MKGVVLMALAMAAVGCGLRQVEGSGKKAEVGRQVDAFHQVALEGRYDVDIQAGPAQSVRIEADDNLLHLIETEVSDGVLKISSRWSLSPKWGIKIHITAPKVDGVSIAGSANVTAEGISADAFSARIAGSGRIEAKGSAARLEIRLAGSGEFSFGDFPVKDASIKISGSGSAVVNASERIEADIAGSGTVRYVGSPKQIKRQIAGSGSVEPK